METVCDAHITKIKANKRKRRRKMKKMKKLFAVILSLAMVLGMSLTAFAEPQQALATLDGVEEGFRLVKLCW